MLNPSFDSESIRVEATRIQSEAAGLLDDPENLGEEKLLQLAFNQPRMGKNTVIGRNGLEKLAPESVAAFYRAFYTPSRMLLVVSGDISSSEILNEVVRIYAKPANPPAKTELPSLPESQSEFRYASLRGRVSVPHLFWGFHAVPESDADASALEVLGAILGLGRSSAFSARLREEKNLALSIESKMMFYPEFGYFLTLAKCDAASIDRSELAILTEMELLKREEPAEADMERAAALLERKHWADLETTSGRARMIARFELTGDWKRMERRVANLRKVKAADVKRVAAKYLRLQKASLLEYMPSDAEERTLTQNALLSTFSGLLDPATDEEQAKRNRQSVLSVTIPPDYNFKFNEMRYPFQTASILRGPSLFIREDHSNPLIEMGFFYPGGRIDERRENSGITRLMTNLMLRGGTDTAQFYRQFEVYGGHMQPVVMDDYFGVYVSVLAQNFEPALRLLVDAIREPSLDKDAVQREAERQIADIRSYRMSRDFPQSVLQQALFENFPYSLESYGSEESVGALTPESIKAWHAAHVRNRKPIVVLIGDTKGTSLASVFVQKFSGARMQEGSIPDAFSKPMQKAGFIDRNWDRNESLILFGFQAPPEDDEDGYTTRVLQGYAGVQGRLAQEIRDKLGSVQELTLAYEPRVRGGSLIVDVSVSPGSEDTVAKGLREEILRMVKGPVQYREFRSAVNQAVGDFAIRHQARAVQIETITRSVLSGKGIDKYENYANALQEVREEDLSAVLERILDMDKAVILIVRGRK
jgi:zinc protease